MKTRPLNRWLSVLMLYLCLVAVRVTAQDTLIRVHDPVMIRHDDRYYLFATGRGIAVWSSPDLKNWRREAPVFNEPPSWTVASVPGFKGYFWAPDISYNHGLYYLYYSVSAFGKNTSCIGVATNVTLDPEDPRFKWVDRGKVIQSYPGVTDWNAIDPNFVEDDEGNAYLAFGSFWGGLKLIPLMADRVTPAQDTLQPLSLASRIRPRDRSILTDIPVSAGDNAIEAPFIFKKNGYYYLFASIDYCCRGVESTYKMIVGRSQHILGPYVDDQGVPMTEGGGKLVLAGDSQWHGVGHNAVYTFEGEDYLIFHGYDGNDNGASKLRVVKLAWDEAGWPVIPE